LEIFSHQGGDYKIKTGAKKYDSFIIGLNFSRDILNKKIYQRLLARFDEGMVDEVKKLHKSGVSWKRLEEFGLEYKFISQYLQKKLDYDEMVGKLNIAIRQFAKRQMTWFRRWEKQGANIHWDKKYEKALEDFIKV
jgi:tRNA dimethylallyltransferase